MWPFRSNTVTVASSGLLAGATECHCHLLPGVDDGVARLDETLATLRLMKSAGIDRVTLTPHVMEDVPNRPADLRRRFADLQSAIADLQPSPASPASPAAPPAGASPSCQPCLSPAPGFSPAAQPAPAAQPEQPSLAGGAYPALALASENMLDTLFADRIAAGDVLPMALRTPGRLDTLLVETSFASPPLRLHDMLNATRRAGFFPLLAHPERYLYMTADDYRRLRADEVLMQLNLPSLLGFYGPAVQRRAEALLAAGAYTVAASDSHSLRWFQRMLAAPLRRSWLPRLAPLYAH